MGSLRILSFGSIEALPMKYARRRILNHRNKYLSKYVIQRFNIIIFDTDLLYIIYNIFIMKNELPYIVTLTSSHGRLRNRPWRLFYRLKSWDRRNDIIMARIKKVEQKWKRPVIISSENAYGQCVCAHDSRKRSEKYPRMTALHIYENGAPHSEKRRYNNTLHADKIY